MPWYRDELERIIHSLEATAAALQAHSSKDERTIGAIGRLVVAQERNNETLNKINKNLKRIADSLDLVDALGDKDGR